MHLLNPGSAAFWKWIEPVDQWLLHQINVEMSNPILDLFFTFFRETLFWMPLYIFLLVFILQNFGTKGIWWALAVILTAAVSDLISSQVVKQIIWRTRPCQDPFLTGKIYFFVNYCPHGSAFTSSHATSHFAQATFFYLTLHHTSKWWKLAFVWAFLIAFSQVYVAVHYPFDVICGAILGCIVGWVITILYNRQFGCIASFN